MALDAESLPLKDRFALVARCVRTARAALEESIDRALKLASAYDVEREQGRLLLANLEAWCGLAERYALAVAAESDREGVS